jgi:D-glycero-D-manno-heptose 1,7-bisphosphate phosphatase
MTKRKAVFLDRDGTIIKFEDLITKPSQLKLLPGAARAVKKFNDLGFLVIVVTNQPVVARGLIEPAGIEVLHEILEKRLERAGARVNAWYFCPHHPEATLKKYRMACSCRKPKPGMFKKAMKRFNIDSRKSYSIGDGIIDIVAGKRAGLKTILVKTGPGHSRLDGIYRDKIKSDFKAKNLGEAVKIVKNR